MLVYVSIFFAPIRIERRVINKVDKYFSIEKNYLTPNRKWYRGTALKEITFLSQKYKRILKYIDFNEIESIRFESVLKKKPENIRYAKRRFVVFVIIVIILLLLSVSGMVGYWEYKYVFFYVVLTIIGLGLPAKMIVTRNFFEKYFAYINYYAFFSRYRLYFKEKKKEHEIFVSTYDASISKYKEFYRRLKRVICFYNLSLDVKYEDEENFGEYSLGCLCDYIKDMRKRNEDINGMIVSLILCTCLQRKVNLNEVTEINIAEVKEVFANCRLERRMCDLMVVLCTEMLRELHGDDESFNKEKVKECVRMLLA